MVDIARFSVGVSFANKYAESGIAEGCQIVPPLGRSQLTRAQIAGSEASTETGFHSVEASTAPALDVDDEPKSLLRPPVEAILVGLY